VFLPYLVFFAENICENRSGISANIPWLDHCGVVWHPAKNLHIKFTLGGAVKVFLRAYELNSVIIC